ncbi:MAG: 50S ribosomal protein L6 [Clostridia bacterium]|nr:50S ribosomal protein L6 [Clostridia bacterium]
MSRIGKKPITIPAGVTVSVDDKNNVVVEGPKGKLEQLVKNSIKVTAENGQVKLETLNNSVEANSMHGLYRTLINNMVLGVTQGFSKNLTINGVGYKVVQKGENLEMSLGLSHTVTVKPMEGIKLSCPTPLEIKVEGISKEQVGQMAANIRAIRPVEPYHAYGIRYSDEVVIKKEGKKAGK